MAYYVEVTLNWDVLGGKEFRYAVASAEEGASDAAEIVEEGYKNDKAGNHVYFPAASIAKVTVIEE